MHVISFGMCPTTVKQLFRCAATTYLSCSLSSSQDVSNGSPAWGLHVVHMMAMHTAFHYRLLTRGSGCTWSLCHVHFCFLYSISEMSWQALIVLFIGRSWQALMDPYALKWTSSEAIRSLNVRATRLKAKWSWVVVYTKFICYVYTCIGRATHLFTLYRY